MSKVKINITIDDELLKDLDNYCEDSYCNRSMTITQSLVQFLNQKKMVDSIQNLSVALMKCAEQGTLDSETKAEMEAFNVLARYFVK